MDLIRALARLGVGIVSAGLLALAVVAASLTRAFRSEMISIRPEFFLHLAATAIGLVALWKLLGGELKIAGKLGAMSLTGFLMANLSVHLPGTWRWGTAAVREADAAGDRYADVLEAPKPVPGTAPVFARDGKPRYWWSPADEPPAFYDRAGLHPERGTALLPVDTPDLFAMILRRQETARRVALPAPAPTTAPTPAAVTEAPVPPVTLPAPERWSAPVRVTAHRAQRK